MMLEMMKKYVEKGESFSFETTMSGKNYSKQIPEWQEKGYKVKLFYLKLPDAALAVARVKQRVKEGGHSVPEDVIRRRFAAGWDNFEGIYKELVDEWAIYDNAGEQPILINEGGKSA